MIGVKEAAQKAVDYLVSVKPNVNQSSIELEEVERSEDEQHWLITLSYSTSGTSPGVAFIGRRKYNLFKVNIDKGEVVWMKIREIHAS
jgi:hypothetical protein